MAAFILCLWVSMVDTSYCVLVFFCRLTIPSHMLPQTNHPTTFSIIRSDNDTILNVLVDMVNFIGLFIVSSLFNLVFFTSLYAVFVSPKAVNVHGHFIIVFLTLPGKC